MRDLITTGAIAAALAFASSPAFADNPPRLVQDIYSSAGIAVSASGATLEATAGNMLSAPIAEGDDNALFQGLIGVIESENAGSGVDFTFADSSSFSLIYDSAAGILRVSKCSGDAELYVADTNGSLMMREKLPSDAAQADIDVSSLSGATYIAGITSGGRIVKVLKFIRR